MKELTTYIFDLGLIPFIEPVPLHRLKLRGIKVREKSENPFLSIFVSQRKSGRKRNQNTKKKSKEELKGYLYFPRSKTGTLTHFESLNVRGDEQDIRSIWVTDESRVVELLSKVHKISHNKTVCRKLSLSILSLVSRNGTNRYDLTKLNLFVLMNILSHSFNMDNFIHWVLIYTKDTPTCPPLYVLFLFLVLCGGVSMEKRRRLKILQTYMTLVTW